MTDIFFTTIERKWLQDVLTTMRECDRHDHDHILIDHFVEKIRYSQ